MPHPTDVHVGRRVRQARLAKGKSQGALGRALGVSFQQVQKYESGANRIGSSRLWDISQTLGTPIDFFFEGLAGDGANGESKSQRPMTRRTIQLAEAISKLNDEEAKTHFLKLVEACARAQ